MNRNESGGRWTSNVHRRTRPELHQRALRVVVVYVRLWGSDEPLTNDRREPAIHPKLPADRAGQPDLVDVTQVTYTSPTRQ